MFQNQLDDDEKGLFWTKFTWEPKPLETSENDLDLE